MKRHKGVEPHRLTYQLNEQICCFFFGVQIKRKIRNNMNILVEKLPIEKQMQFLMDY